MPDTLARVVDTIFIKQNENYELLNKVDSFYNSAWTKLVIVGSVSFAIVGIVLPLIIQWYQKRIIKLSELNLIDKLNSLVLQETKKVEESIEKKIEEKTKEINKISIKNEAMREGQIFHLQAMIKVNEKDYVSGYSNLITSCKSYLKADDDRNIFAIVTGIKNILNFIKAQDIHDEKVKGNDLESLIAVLEKNKNPLLYNSVTDLKVTLTKKIKE